MSDRVIKPYELLSNGSDYSTIVMPVYAETVDLGPYNGKPAIWAIVDLDARTELRRFKMVMDGFTVPDPGRYIGSMTMYQGDTYIPVHFFEVPPPITEEVNA